MPADPAPAGPAPVGPGPAGPASADPAPAGPGPAGPAPVGPGPAGPAPAPAGPPGVQVHPLGLCESDSVGAGTRIWAWAHVLPGAVIGPDCNICDHAYVEGGVRLGARVTVKNAVLLFDMVDVADDVFLGPNVVFTNDLRPRAHVKRGRDAFLPTFVGPGATIGAGSTIVCGTTIGPYAFVAAGSVVTRDVPPHAFAAGNPARRKGWVCACGAPLDTTLTCTCGHKLHLGRTEADGLTLLR
jgi:UDP-2-acetamido-3-amino-2,3-dideoxy-glucuronate N-acetyltransferase